MRSMMAFVLVLAPLVLAGPVSAQAGRQRAQESRDRLREQRMSLERHHAELEAMLHAEQQIEHVIDDVLRHVPHLDVAAFDEVLDELYGDGPAVSISPQDSADGLWRQGREHLNARRYREAVASFERIRTEARFANSVYRADAHYWEAYALARLGNEEDLQRARPILEALLRYPPSQRTPDADGLMVAIQSRLARLGNREAEQALVARATQLATPVSGQHAADLTRALAEQVGVIDLQTRVLAEDARLLAGREALLATTLSGQHIAQLASPEFRGSLVWSAGLPGSIPQQCRTDQEEIRIVALNSLARLDATSATPILREVMARRGECAEFLRRQALTIAAQHRAPDAVELVLDAARNDPDRIVRVTALQLLVELDEDRAVGLIEERLRNTADTAGMREALSAEGGRARSDRLARVLRELAARSDVPAAIRRDAILGLARRQDAETRNALRQLYRQTDERRVREAILAVAATGDAESTDWLLGIASDPQESEAMRRAALMRVAATTDIPVERFSTLYDRFTDVAMKAAVIETLSARARSDRAATDKLLAIARTETDTALRKQAILALSHSDDPRARELLLEILRR